MTLKVTRLSLSGSPLSDAYLRDDPIVRSFYQAGPPTDIRSYRRVLDFIRVSSPEARWEALEQTRDLAALAAARPLERLIAERGVFVATGQQAGLFGGPLFTLYKALTAARLARQLEAKLGVPVMPLFGVASEDHDWPEVNHTHVLDQNNQLVRIAVGEPEADDVSTPHPPVYRIQVGEDIERGLEQLSSSAPDTEFREDILRPLREAYTPGRGYADAFAQILRNLLRSYPFLVVSNYHPFVKSESRQLLLAEWNARQESEAKLRDRGEELSSAGFNPQVSVPPGATNLFVEGRLGRDRLLYDGQGAVLRRSGERMTEAEVRGLIEEETERVSPGVLLRPIAEATVFPIVAHVVGSSEIAYLAQSQVLYSLHEVPAPVIVPRASMQLIETKISKVLDKFGIEPSRLDGDATRAINLVLRERAPTRLMESLAALREVLADSLAEVQSAAEAADPGATSALESGRKSILGSVAALEAKLLTRLKDKDQVAQQQLAKAAIHLSPGGQPQERVLSAYQYLMRYGEGFLDTIEANVITPLD